MEKIRDLVLFRYGATGVQDAIKKAVDVKGYIPVYPVRNLNKFTSDRFVLCPFSLSLSLARHLMRVSCRVSCVLCRSGGVFRDCLLAPPGTTIREFARMVDHQMEQFFAYAEGLSGQRVRAILAVVSHTLSLFLTLCRVRAVRVCRVACRAASS